MTHTEKSKVLIVDDIADNIRVLGQMLSEKNYDITVAMNGVEALESIDAEKPDLILLDINMPGMDGYEVCEKIKANADTSDIPVIFLTANTEIDKVVKGFDVGAVDYITKPFNSKELFSRVKTQLEIINTRRQLEESLAIKNRFFRIIAHDLRSPFNALIGFSNLLLTDTKINSDQKEAFIQVIHETSRKGLGLLDNLLTWARTQTNTIEQKTEKLNLRLVSETVTQLLGLSALHKNISIENMIPSDIYVMADNQALQTIFRNLVSNAIKFTKEEGNILLQAYSRDNKVVISVNDNGVGIDDEIKENIFRIDKKTTSEGTNKETGTGLGLILVKDFVEKNGGIINVESKVGEGTTFIFTLPAA